MIWEISDKFWQAEAKSEETKRLFQDIKRITGCKFTAEEKFYIVVEGSTCDHPLKTSTVEKALAQAHIMPGLKDFRDSTRPEEETLEWENTKSR